MRIVRKAGGAPVRLGILSGAFHPPTCAHLALAQSALDTTEADEVLFVLPAVFPHKSYEGVSLEQRLDLLEAATAHDPRYSIAVSEGGLFLEIARECRSLYGAGATLRFICGRDTAERIVNWSYTGQPPIEAQLAEYELLVAARQGVYESPAHLRGVIHELAVNGEYDDVSSTEVRDRIAHGLVWEHLVPEPIVRRVIELYRK